MPLPNPSLDSANTAAQLELDPVTPLDAAYPVLRLRIHLPSTQDIDLAKILVVQGEMSDAHLRQVERDDISNALSERIVPSIAWLDPVDPIVVVAPLTILTPGQTYAIASGAPTFLQHIQIAESGTPPILPRIWPPPGLAATVSMGIWCGQQQLAKNSVAEELAPMGLAGLLQTGAVSDAGLHCLRFETTQPPDETLAEPLVPPPAFVVDDIVASLDPRPFQIETSVQQASSIECQSQEMAFGPGCALIADDRLYVRNGDVPLLWVVTGQGLDQVLPAQPNELFLITPLPPLSSITLLMTTVDVGGGLNQFDFSGVTLPPMAHLVITEVVANPLGAEPAQEWVELYNDGLAPAELEGYVLADIGGETVLPKATLMPGTFALVVNETFEPDDGLDPVPAPSTLLIRVPKLGKNGLANAGEPLKLKNELGEVVSTTPATPKPKAGMSVARLTPQASSFALANPTPGEHNTFEHP